MVIDKENTRSYERTWHEIEMMLDEAITKRKEWENHFNNARRLDDRSGQMTAARNVKALQGVIKTLRWVLGDKGIDHPLS